MIGWTVSNVSYHKVSLILHTFLEYFASYKKLHSNEYLSQTIHKRYISILFLYICDSPNLTWRDIQHLIVLTSSSSGINVTYSNWKLNGALKECKFTIKYVILEMPVPSQGHYGFHSFPVVDWFCLFIYLWVLTFPL